MGPRAYDKANILPRTLFVLFPVSIPFHLALRWQYIANQIWHGSLVQRLLPLVTDRHSGRRASSVNSFAGLAAAIVSLNFSSAFFTVGFLRFLSQLERVRLIIEK